MYRPKTRILPALLVAAASVTILSQTPSQASEPPPAARPCLGCHTFDKGAGPRIGPNLWGVFNSQAGSKEDFGYSDAVRSAGEDGLVWTEETLDSWLQGARKYIKGTRMSYPGIKDAEKRKEVIEFLKTLK